MGSVYNRGTRSKPNWYVAYKDRNGKRCAVASRQPTKVLARRFLEQIEARIAAGHVGIEQKREEPTCAELLEDWMSGMSNRTAYKDRIDVRRVLVPAFGDVRLTAIDLPAVMRWLDSQRAGGQLADSSIRRYLGLLSRFFAWAIERGYTDINPVRQIPTNKRPKASPKRDIPWLQDDSIVRRILDVLPEPTNYLFYLGNQSGMRTGELISLRLSDFDYLDEGVIRVRYSHDGPLKEDKREEGKTKWVPAADGCAVYLGPWLNKRRDETNDAECHVFPRRRNARKPFSPNTLDNHWRTVRKLLGIQLTWYQATRHSFASRLSAAGVPLDEIADALGHASPVVTRRYYDHFIRRSFSDRLRSGLTLNPVDAAPTAIEQRPDSGQLRRIGVLGDIHSQDAHVAKALVFLRDADVDRVLSVGDIVDGPGDLARTCKLLAASKVEAVRGNHERWLLSDTMRDVPDAITLADLGDLERQFLEGLPVVREYTTAAGRMLLCHGIGLDDMASIGPNDNADDNLALQALIATGCYQWVINGHVHKRTVRRVGSLTLINAGALSQGFACIDLTVGEVIFYDLRHDAGDLVVIEAERQAL